MLFRSVIIGPLADDLVVSGIPVNMEFGALPTPVAPQAGLPFAGARVGAGGGPVIIDFEVIGEAFGILDFPGTEKADDFFLGGGSGLEFVRGDGPGSDFFFRATPSSSGDSSPV